MAVTKVLIFCMLLGFVQAQTLDPFTSIEVCSAGAVGVQPSSDGTYSYELQGNSDLFDSYQAGTLHFSHR